MRVVLKEEAAFYAVHGVALLQKEFCEIRAVLIIPVMRATGRSMQAIVQVLQSPIIS